MRARPPSGFPPWLSFDRLENPRQNGPGKWIARCPACAEEGGDRHDEHLVVFSDGAYACVAHPDHRKRIWQIVGKRRGVSSLSRYSPGYRKARRSQRNAESDRAKSHRLAGDARAGLPELLRQWRWPLKEVRHASPTSPGAEADDPRYFLSRLFSPRDLVWTGKIYESGPRHAARWRTVEEWREAGSEEIGPYVAPATWSAGCRRRRGQNVTTQPYVVLDFDGPSGRYPKGDDELARHLKDSLAVIRWLWQDRKWALAAILWTGSKSLHAWFDHPGDAILRTFKESLPILGIDPTLVGHPEHPCRLPGQAHHKTVNLSETLWLR